MFRLTAQEVPEFVRSMELVRDAQAFDSLVGRWGGRRSHPEFWRYFHDLSAYIRETEPLEAGVLDMHRYENM